MAPSPNPERAPQADIYFLKDGVLPTRGRIVAEQEPHVWVETDNESRRVHRTGVFPPASVMELGQDLVAPVQPGEEREVSTVVHELLHDPETAQEMVFRMGAAAVGEYIGAPRTDRDYGIRTVDELVGDPHTKYTNAWTVEEFIYGLAAGDYGPNLKNNLSLAKISADAELLPEEEQTRIRTKIENANRDALDKLYEQYDVDFARAVIVEKIGADNLREVVTVYPTMGDGYSFVETAWYDQGVDYQSGAAPKSRRVDIVAGKPQFSLEDGYSPSV